MWHRRRIGRVVHAGALGMCVSSFVVGVAIIAGAQAEAPVVRGVFAPDGDPVVFLGFLTIFALFGALARLLAEWRVDYTLARVLGTVMGSVFAADVVGLLLWDAFSARPTFLMGAAAAISWLGGPVLDRIAPALTTRLLGPTSVPPEEKS